MAPLFARIKVVRNFLVDRLRYGVPECLGPMDREVLFLVDGVGRFQAGALMARRALRELGADMGTVLYDWQTFIFGEVLSDLMWYRRNRLMGVKLARKLLTFRRRHPDTRIHILSFSGGAGIAIFALEALRDRSLIDTLILACPAMSSTYNLAPALRTVQRAYALTSHRDSVILGWGTRILGTTDRRHEPGAGLVGFRIPPGLSQPDSDTYRRLQEIRWTPDLKKLGHPGGHTGWAGAKLLRLHLLPFLRGEPALPAHEVGSPINS